jgi:hypothetical protein
MENESHTIDLSQEHVYELLRANKGKQHTIVFDAEKEQAMSDLVRELRTMTTDYVCAFRDAFIEKHRELRSV